MVSSKTPLRKETCPFESLTALQDPLIELEPRSRALLGAVHQTSVQKTRFYRRKMYSTNIARLLCRKPDFIAGKCIQPISPDFCAENQILLKENVFNQYREKTFIILFFFSFFPKVSHLSMKEGVLKRGGLLTDSFLIKSL